MIRYKIAYLPDYRKTKLHHSISHFSAIDSSFKLLDR